VTSDERAAVLVKRDGTIATVVLSNPDRLNALTVSMWRELKRTLDALSADEAFDDERRSDFLIAAGDILVQHYGDSVAARTLFDRARGLWPGNPSLWHVSESSKI